jgi:chromate transporter
VPLGEIARVFLKLGLIGFGGPAAHIALMQREVVQRRQWLNDAEFLDLLGATNLIPGPNSTELAIHLGYRRGGFTGLIVAGSCFIIPAVVLVLVCAWAYVNFGKLPAATAVLYGIKPVIIAVVFQALHPLAKSAIKNWLLGIIALLAVGFGWLHLNELILLGAAGAVTMLIHGFRRLPKGMPLALPFPALNPAAATTVLGAASVTVTATVPASFQLWALFGVFLKIGAVLYGSGYVLLAFLRRDLVERLRWLTESQLLDAVAVGQITPGPLFTTATFIGYLLGGIPAALVATVGIFLPAFFFVAISGPLVPLIRRSPLAGAFLDGINVASLALMTVVTGQLARAALIDTVTVALALASAFALVRWKLNSAWLVAGGALAGWLRFYFG